MNQLLLLAGVVIVACILMNRIAAKLPLPSLLLFIGLGMCFGVDGFFKIPFDDYELSEVICSVSLLFVMFYGGFGTNLKTAKPVMGKAFLLSTAGVVMTAALVGAAAHVLLGVGWMEGILIGSVIASTDAASVFNVLRFKQLSLKYNTDSLLELESGSNDPISYMMTILMISLVSGEQISVAGLLLKQILIGAACGFLIGKASVFILNQIDFGMKQGRTIFLFAAVIVGYALPSVAGGNGYLSVYLCGILIGNRFIPDKKEMVHFFDILTETAQMVIFFLLGLLVTPSQLPEVFVPALLLCLFMLFIGRPVSVLTILKPFGASWQQIGVVSWGGLRGVASIVFSIYVVLSGIPMTYNLFNMVFVIVLLSLAVQGTLLPAVSRKLEMIDKNANVMRTFNDYQDENDISFVKIKITDNHPFAGKTLKEIEMPPGVLVVLLFRGQETMMPNGDTSLEGGDLLICAAPAFEDRENLTLYEVEIDKNHKWRDKPVNELDQKAGVLIVMVKREGSTLIPNGNTIIRQDDLLVFRRQKHAKQAHG